MTDIFTLLSFPNPNNSPAFSKYGNPSQADAGLNSPPRKSRRLDASSDSASASRVKETRDGSTDAKGRIILQLVGAPIGKPEPHFYDADYRLIKRCVNLTLTRGNREPLPTVYEKIYSACRSVVCLAKKGDGLYNDVVKLELERAIGEVERSLIREEKSEVEWCVPFIETCRWFERQVSLLGCLLAYLDREYVLSQRGLLSIRSLAYTQFANRTFGQIDVARRLHGSIEEWALWERQNRSEHSLRPYIPQLISRLEHHGQYDTVFEAYYLKITKDFYSVESDDQAGMLDALGFIDHCVRRRDEEIKRTKDVLPISSLTAVLDAVDRALLGNRLEWLVKDALPTLMDRKSSSELSRLYKLFGKVDGEKIFLGGFQSYIQRKVKEIVTNKEEDEHMVRNLLEFKSFADHLASDAFGIEKPDPSSQPQPPPAPSQPSTSADAMDVDEEPTIKVLNRDFYYALGDAFRKGFLARRNKPAEMLAKHLDSALRKGQGVKKTEDYMKELDAILGLYRFTDDKDVFRTFYHRALAKRMLLEKAASDDIEKLMLKKLQGEYDADFNMGDQMFNDLALSKELMNEFRRHVGPREVTMNTIVIQRSFWPFTGKTKDGKDIKAVDLTPSMTDELTRYTRFYKMKHSARTLEWDHSLGTAILQARFNRGEKRLSVSLYQAIVLLLFNDENSMSYHDIKERTRMEDSELIRTLQSLAIGKHNVQVLRQQPLGKVVKKSDIFHFNPDYWSELYRIHINTIQVNETPEESKKTQSLIENDRKYVLDAAIVRIMKSKKEVHNEQLKTLTIDSVKNHFVPDVAMIKSRIESLIESDYMVRKEGDNNVFVYVA